MPKKSNIVKAQIEKPSKETKEIVKVEPVQLLRMTPLKDMKEWYNDFVKFSKEILKDGMDYGVIPGVEKPSLFKPGAEKLRFVYGLGVTITMVDKTVDLKEGIIDYTYKATVTTRANQILSECEGSANSYEPKFRYIWVKEEDLPKEINKGELKTRDAKINEFDFAIQKAETTGQYGKPAEYWAKFKDAIANGTAKEITRKTSTGKEMKAWEIGSVLYRIGNEDVVGLKNTIMKMAQKRAFVGAIMLATGASEFFTQDVEDMEIPVDESSELIALKKQKVNEQVEVSESALKQYLDLTKNAKDRNELYDLENTVKVDPKLTPKEKWIIRKEIAVQRGKLPPIEDIPF